MIQRRSILKKLSAEQSIDDILDKYRPDTEQGTSNKNASDYKLISNRTVKQQQTMKELHRYNQRRSFAKIAVEQDLRRVLHEDRDSVGLGSYVLLQRGLLGQIVKVYPDGNTYDMVVSPTGDIIQISGSEILRTIRYA